MRAEKGCRFTIFVSRRNLFPTGRWRPTLPSLSGRFRPDAGFGHELLPLPDCSSRVCPEGDGEFNEEGIAFYHQFIDELIARGIEPMICLYHLGYAAVAG